MASSFLLNTLFKISVKHIFSAASIKLPDGVSLLEDVFVAGVDGVVSEKVTHAFVGVDFDLVAFVCWHLVEQIDRVVCVERFGRVIQSEVK